MNGVFNIKYIIFSRTYYLHMQNKKVNSMNKNRLYISFETDIESKK